MGIEVPSRKLKWKGRILHTERLTNTFPISSPWIEWVFADLTSVCEHCDEGYLIGKISSQGNREEMSSERTCFSFLLLAWQSWWFRPSQSQRWKVRGLPGNRVESSSCWGYTGSRCLPRKMCPGMSRSILQRWERSLWVTGLEIIFFLISCRTFWGHLNCIWRCLSFLSR